MNRFRSNPRGFSLIEVLIAFVILAVASLALYRGMTAGLSGTEAAEARIAAVQVARSKLAEVGAAIRVEPGTQNGSDGNGFRWTIEMAPFLDRASKTTVGDQSEAASSGVAVFRVTVTVTDRRGSPVTLTSWRMAQRP